MRTPHVLLFWRLGHLTFVQLTLGQPLRARAEITCTVVPPIHLGHLRCSSLTTQRGCALLVPCQPSVSTALCVQVIPARALNPQCTFLCSVIIYGHAPPAFRHATRCAHMRSPSIAPLPSDALSMPAFLFLEHPQKSSRTSSCL